MVLIYKTFKPARIVFFGLLLAFFSPLAAMAANPLYTVEGVIVDVTSTSAAKAREEAFNKAQQDAFNVLATRMVSEAQATSFEVTDPAAISTMINDFEVTQEKLSSVRYVGTYTFNFDENAVKSFFSVKGASYSDTFSPPALVLPFYQKGNVTTLWSEDNIWMQAWGRAGDLKGVVPLVVPIGDVMDVSDIGDDQMSDYDAQKLQSMVTRYDAENAAIMMAIPDMALMESEVDAPAKGALSVQIFRAEITGPQLVKTVIITADGTENVQSVYDRAVRESKSALQQNWRQQAIAEPVATPLSANSRIDVRVFFTGLEEWARAQREIKATYGVKDLIVKSLSPNQALVQLGYAGDVENLRLALQQNRMVLSPPPASGSYESPYAAAQALPVYNLRLNGPAMPVGVPVDDY